MYICIMIHMCSWTRKSTSSSTYLSMNYFLFFLFALTRSDSRFSSLNSSRLIYVFATGEIEEIVHIQVISIVALELLHWNGEKKNLFLIIFILT